jgi:proteasome lid subunit RPN8/RPN11
VHRRRDGNRDGGGGAIALRLARLVIDEVVAHAREASPAECCGVLLGTDSEVVEAVRTDNLSEDPNRYRVDPKGHFDARRSARRRGLEVVGFYHSHPHSEPEPSAADVSEATYPGYLYLIVRPLVEDAKIRVFRLEQGRFLEVGFSL